MEFIPKGMTVSFPRFVVHTAGQDEWLGGVCAHLFQPGLEMKHQRESFVEVLYIFSSYPQYMNNNLFFVC